MSFKPLHTILYNFINNLSYTQGGNSYISIDNIMKNNKAHSNKQLSNMRAYWSCYLFECSKEKC